MASRGEIAILAIIVLVLIITLFLVISAAITANAAPSSGGTTSGGGLLGYWRNIYVPRQGRNTANPSRGAASPPTRKSERVNGKLPTTRMKAKPFLTAASPGGAGEHRVPDFSGAVLATSATGSSSRFVNVAKDGVTLTFSTSPQNTYKYTRGRLYRGHWADGEVAIQYNVAPGPTVGTLYLANVRDGYHLTDPNTGEPVALTILRRA